MEIGWEGARIGHVLGRKIDVRVCERVGVIIVGKTSGKYDGFLHWKGSRRIDESVDDRIGGSTGWRTSVTQYGSVGWYSGVSGGRLTASRSFTLVK